MKFRTFFLVVVTFSLSVEMGFSNEDFLKRGSRDLNGWKQLFNMLGQLTEEKNQDEEAYLTQIQDFLRRQKSLN